MSTTTKATKRKDHVVERGKEGLVESITGLDVAMRKVARFARQIEDAEELKLRAEDLQHELTRKEGELQQAGMAKKVLIDEFTEKTVEWSQDKIRLEQEVSGTRMHLDDLYSKKLQAAENALQAALTDAQGKGQDLESSQAQVVVLENTLRNIKEELASIKSTVGVLDSDHDL